MVRRDDNEISLENIVASLSIERPKIEALLRSEEPAHTFLSLTTSQATALQELFAPLGVDFFSTDIMAKLQELERQTNKVKSALDSRKK